MDDPVAERNPVFKVKAVAFDLDGVILETESFNIRSAFEAFRRYGHALEPTDTTQIVGRHPVDYVPLLAPRFGLADDVQGELLQVQSKIYLQLWLEEAELKEGVVEILDTLRERGYPVALATSGSRKHVSRCLDRFSLESYFDIVLTKDDVTRRKPDPEVYLSCSRQFAVEPSEMAVVEDSGHGVRAAKEAGATCIAVRTSHIPAEAIAGADAAIDSLLELGSLLPLTPGR